MKNEIKSFLPVASDAIFVLLPIGIIAMLTLFSPSATSIWDRSEWSFGAVILFGQGIVRLTAGTAKSSKRKKWQLVAIIITAVICLGLVPSTLTLYVMTTASFASWVVVLQQVLFWLAIVFYLIMGTVGQMYIEESD